MQTNEPPLALPDVTAAAERLRAVRAERAGRRRSARAVVDALRAETQRRIGSVFTDDDPITGRPVCLLITSDDRLDDAYEAQSPRPIPDSPNRLTIEILGRVLTIELDDFGAVSITGVDGAGDVHAASIVGSDVVFLPEKRDAPHVTFAAILARFLDDVSNQERRVMTPDMN